LAALAVTAVIGATALLLASCASAAPSSTAAPTSTGAATSTAAGKLAVMTKVSLLLDFHVYGAHAGIYDAIEKGYYKADNIDLTVTQPNDTATSLKLVQAGKADIGLASPIDMIAADASGSPYTAFLSIVGGNLEGLAVRTDSGITRMKDLAGKKIGIGSPASKALIAAQISGGGGDPGKSTFIITGENFMQYLSAGSIDAAGAFLPDVASANLSGAKVSFIPLGKDGGLAFPSLVAYANKSTLASDPALIRAFTDATVKGYLDTIEHPAQSAAATAAANPGLKYADFAAQVQAIGAAFQGSSPEYGYVNVGHLQALADFLQRSGAVTNPPKASEFATDEFVQKAK
jgi:NitT/TauT family transport system substrate-binding protein/putative hydroxymethylpyrimidine transport system substrate-binding protein